MRILVLHNWYQQTGGEDTVVQSEVGLLAEAGNEVQLHAADNRFIIGFPEKVRTAVKTPHSRTSRSQVRSVIADFQPDVVHLHNFFPLLSPSVLDACAHARLPVVHTLHNYRLFCAGALLMRDGQPCEICLDGTALKAVEYGCYRGSRLGTLAVASMIEVHRRLGTWGEKVDRFVTLTEFSRRLFVRAGLPEEKIAIKPNTLSRRGQRLSDAVRARRGEGTFSGAVFMGRLSPEKGLATLLEAWEQVPSHLQIVGDGPLAGFVANKALASHGHVSHAGYLQVNEVSEALANAAFLVLPSECYEGFSLSLVEAFAHGLPVLVSRLGSMAEIVDDGVNGLHFTAGDAEDLAAKARWLGENPEECRRMGENARRVYEERYTPERNYGLLMDIYAEAVEAARQRYSVRTA